MMPKWEWVTVPTDGHDPRAIRRVRKFNCKNGEHPWDDWYCEARAAGIETEVALLGSAVMRAADRHGWPDALQAECGWNDAGAAMIALALRDTESARARWKELLEASERAPAEADPGQHS
jgi:hypothetical protein